MHIYINNQLAALKKGTSFEYVSENRLFSGSDGYTLTITFPLKDCPENLAIFGHINRADVAAQKVVFDCEIRDKGFIKFGKITITEISESEIKAQFLEGKSSVNFDTTLNNIYINELDLGKPKFSNSSDISVDNAWSPVFNKMESVALPWVNNDSGNLQNEPTCVDGHWKWNEDTSELSFFPYLLFITKQICKAIGFDFDFSKWEEREDLKYLLICNALPAAWDLNDYADALPHWSVADYFSFLEDFLFCEFDFNFRDKKINLNFSVDVLNSCKLVELDKVVYEHTASFKSESKDFNFKLQKNIRFSETDHIMKSFYNCTGFVNKYKDKAIVYNNINEFIADTRSLSSWMGEHNRNSLFDKLFYVKNIDTYFVIRAIFKNLYIEHKDRPNQYKYDCVLQPINNFGDFIFSDSDNDDSIELNFVPVCVEYIDRELGRAAILNFSNSSDDSDVQLIPKTVEEYKFQCDTRFDNSKMVNALEAFKDVDSNKGGFFDKIFIGYWDGTVIENNKLPFPFVDHVTISQDWNSVYMAHFNIRLNDHLKNDKKRWLVANPTRSYTFKFLADSLPDPRDIFLIEGKRYLCEKLTATFSESGMSQLIKGVFWPVDE